MISEWVYSIWYRLVLHLQAVDLVPGKQSASTALLWRIELLPLPGCGIRLLLSSRKRKCFNGNFDSLGFIKEANVCKLYQLRYLLFCCQYVYNDTIIFIEITICRLQVSPRDVTLFKNGGHLSVVKVDASDFVFWFLMFSRYSDFICTGRHWAGN